MQYKVAYILNKLGIQGAALSILKRVDKKAEASKTMHAIFVHGLNGDYLQTWQSSSSPPEFWPEWLSEDIPGLSVWTLGYAASSSRWRSGNAMALPDRAENLLPLLTREQELLSGKIAFLAHSLGGMVVEQILRVAEGKIPYDPAARNFLERVRKVVFLSTPQAGSRLASVSNSTSFFTRPRPSVAGLSLGDPHLRELNGWFRKYIDKTELAALVLTETMPTRLTRWLPFIKAVVVEPYSADPGLSPHTEVIPVDEDHFSIVSPANQDSYVYKLVRDFLRRDDVSSHKKLGAAQVQGLTSQVERATDIISSLRDDVGKGSAQILGAIERLASTTQETAPSIAQSSATTENPVITNEALSRLIRLKQSRFVIDFDRTSECERLFNDLVVGHLNAASLNARHLGACWCVRIMSALDADRAQNMLSVARRFGHGEQLEIATAVVRLYHQNDKAGALSLLKAYDTPAAKTASMLIGCHGLEPAEALQWIEKAGISTQDLDSDGKLSIIQRRIEAAEWEQAAEDIEKLTDYDYQETPVLHSQAGIVQLAQAVHPELREAVTQYLPLDLRDFPLGDDATSLQLRRQARKEFKSAAVALAGLGLTRASYFAADFALWLGLRDPENEEEARLELEESLRISPQSLRRLPFALEFGLKLDLNATEREIDRESVRSAGKSPEVAIARFALARTKNSPQEVIEYLEKHKLEVIEYYNPDLLTAVEAEMFARSGQSQQALERLSELRKSGSVTEGALHRLELMVEKKSDDDSLSEMEIRFKSTGNLADLVPLVEALKRDGDSEKTIEYRKILFEKTKNLQAALDLFESLLRTGNENEILKFSKIYPELLERSDQIRRIVAWASYRLGSLDAAQTLLDEIGEENENDRNLRLNIAVASGDWSTLGKYVETMWAQRSSRSASELLRAGHLAQRIGLAPRSQQLVREAASRGSSDPAILTGCYGIATSAGWEDDTGVYEWIATAANLSGEDGPVQKFDLRQLLDMAPDWNERSKRTVDELMSGQLPMFGAARLLNRSLLDLELTSALANITQSDPRKRSLVFAYSGARGVEKIEGDSLTFDPSAILTLAMLDLLDQAINHFKTIFISHSTMGWLFEESHRLQFHQPSRVEAARRLKALIDGRFLERFVGPNNPPASLVAQVGDSLASQLHAACGAPNGDDRLKVVVRPAPVPKLSTLMDEEADLSAYKGALVGCTDIVLALSEAGRITEAEKLRALDYLKARERPWVDTPPLLPGTLLFLDGLAVTYLDHLKLLDKFKAAGFVAYVAESEINEADALIRHEAHAELAKVLVERIRISLAEGIASRKVQLLPLPRSNGEDLLSLKDHPTSIIFHGVGRTDGFVIDDRCINQHGQIQTPAGIFPIHTSLEIIYRLSSDKAITSEQQQEGITRLREAGYVFVPTPSEELISLLEAAPIKEGRIVETAELRAVRESLLRIRMTDVLQLPRESVWIDEIHRSLATAIRAQWSHSIATELSEARSNWLFSQFDVRGWTHRMAEPASDPLVRFRAQLMMLMMLPESDVGVRKRYWNWFEGNVLNQLRSEDEATYSAIVDNIQVMIEERSSQLDMVRDD